MWHGVKKRGEVHPLLSFADMVLPAGGTQVAMLVQAGRVRQVHTSFHDGVQGRRECRNNW